MKLLLSAYACAPNRGSDHGVGWSWTTEAHRLGHEVWALVSPAHHDSITSACHDNPELSGIHWIFPEVRGWPLKPAIEPRWERTYNLLWQRAALRHARGLHRQVGFDAVHHITWGGIRAPTFLGSLGIPLIIGPIGGGETSPVSLRDGLGTRGRLVERIRDLSTATISINPLVRPGHKAAKTIFAHTADTKNLFSAPLRDKVVIFTPVSLSKRPPADTVHIRPGTARLLYAGRLLYWKGVHIALRAFAEVASRVPDAHFTIVGDGPERSRLEADASRYGVQGKVDFISRMPQDKLFELYGNHTIFLFPSLHDAGGMVVMEAMAHGMPVICLDLGGPRELVTPDCGVVVETKDHNTAEVAAAMAGQICRLLETPTELARLSAGALARAHEFVVTDRVREFYGIALKSVVKND
jgi:glycosyltransferase involved in cell wall biosynthesis